MTRTRAATHRHTPTLGAAELGTREATDIRPTYTLRAIHPTRRHTPPWPRAYRAWAHRHHALGADIAYRLRCIAYRLSLYRRRIAGASPLYRRRIAITHKGVWPRAAGTPYAIPRLVTTRTRYTSRLVSVRDIHLVTYLST